MSILKAAKHYGLARKNYSFEMKIHRLILPTSGNKLVTRILWSRRKKRSEKHKTSWIEGVEEFRINQIITHCATIFLTSTTNQIQSKYTTISIEMKNEIKDKKYTKYCSFKIDLSDYINITSPQKIFSKHLKYKNNSGTKKAELIFSIKSTEICNNNNNNNNNAEHKNGRNGRNGSQLSSTYISEDDVSQLTNVSLLSKTSLDSNTFNELRKKHVANQRNYNIVRHNNNNNNNNCNYNIDKDLSDNNPPPFIINEYQITPPPPPPPPPQPLSNDEEEESVHCSPSLPLQKSRKYQDGCAISIYSSSDGSDDDENNKSEIEKLRKDIIYYKKKMIEYHRMKEKLKSNEYKMEKLKKDNSRLQLKVSSLQTEIEHKKNEQYNTFSVFRYLTFYECDKLQIGDYIDHRDETGHFLLAKIINLNKKKNYIHIHYEGWASKWDIWVNIKKSCNLNKIAKPRSISRKSNTRFLELQIGDNIDLNPIQRHSGWRQGKIKKMDKYSGQIQVEYIQNNEKYFYWAHLNDINEIAPFMTKSCD